MADPEIKSTMDFPARSQASTDEMFTWDEVKAMLDKEYMRRAEYVTRIVRALQERYGDEVYDLVRDVIYQIGYEKGQARAALVAERGEEASLEALAELVAHRTARLYHGTEPEIGEGKLVIRESYCPLPIKWKAMGLTDEEMVRFCLMFDQVDCGMIEGYSSDLRVELTGCRGLAANGTCQMVVTKKPG